MCDSNQQPVSVCEMISNYCRSAAPVGRQEWNSKFVSKTKEVRKVWWKYTCPRERKGERVKYVS
jgi:hypothetical protein